MHSTQKSSYQYSQNLNDIIDILDTGVETASSIRNVVTPLIERVKYSETCYKAVEEMLLSSPQCQKLRNENEMLRKKCGFESPNIFVEVNERKNSKEHDIKKVRTDLPCNYGGSFLNDKLQVFSILIDEWCASNVDIPSSTIKTAFNNLFNNIIIKDNESQTEELDKIVVETPCDQAINSRSRRNDNATVEENVELFCPTHTAVTAEEEEEEEEDEEVEEEEVEEEEEEEDEEEDEEEEETDKESPVPSTERKVPNENLEEDVEEDVFEIEMEDEDGAQLRYYTNNEENGDIYEILPDDEIGSKIGKFVDGEPEFFEE